MEQWDGANLMLTEHPVPIELVVSSVRPALLVTDGVPPSRLRRSATKWAASHGSCVAFHFPCSRIRGWMVSIEPTTAALAAEGLSQRLVDERPNLLKGMA